MRTGASAASVPPPAPAAGRAPRSLPGPSAGRVGPAASPLLPVEGQKVLVPSPVRRQLWMEGERQPVALLDGHHLIAVARQLLDAVAVLDQLRSADKNRGSRAAVGVGLDLGLVVIDLSAIGVSTQPDVHLMLRTLF